MTAVNPLDGIGAALKADEDLAGVVAGRVFWPALPRDQDNNVTTPMPNPAVVLRPAGGGMRYGRGTLRLSDPRFDTDCYGATLAQSVQVHLAVQAALRRLVRQAAGGVLVHGLAVSNGGVTDVDPDTKWPLTIASYVAVVSDVPVAA
jgi:hypothetical protein